MVLRRLQRNTSTLLGGAITALVLLAALIGPLLTPYDPLDVSHPRFSPPDSRYLFGTDELGRDILTRVLYGARLSLLVGLVSVGLALLIGVPLGLLAGYHGRSWDGLIMRLLDVMLAFPGLLLAITVVAVLGPGLRNAMIAVGIASIPTYARVVRASILAEKTKPYVEAARTIGVPTTRLLWRHLLPNVVSPLIVLSTLGVGSAILAAAGLSFVGLGAQLPTPEWGAMLSRGRDYLAYEWWIATFPGLAIAVTVLGVNLLGDSLRDALDPRLKI